MPHVPSEKVKDRVYCPWPGCAKHYADKSGLSHHKRVHDPFATMYECPFCDTKMNQKANLDSHIKNTQCNGPQDLNATVSSSLALQPTQLLSAANAGEPLKGLGVFSASPQSQLDAWSPKELISIPDSSPNSYIASKLSESPTFYEHQIDCQRTVSNVDTLDEMEQWLQIYSNSSNFDVNNAVSFEPSFSVPSSSISSDYSVSPASSSFIKDDHLSFNPKQMLASYLPRDSALSMQCPPMVGAVDMTINASSPSPIDNSSTVVFSFLSFETTDSPFSIDSGVSLPLSSSFEQPVFDFSFEQSVGITDSFSFF
ncbi:hypothetical protein IW262DRAFT_1519128 [Armillaria fumosa]|nr:hypothetical protein IW262DRAFT_1519128 [Armillaria fumosa]